MALAPYLKPCFTVPFICPKGQAGLRHYHVQTLQEYWSECTPTSFLEEACNCGYQLVKHSEEHSKDQEKLYHAHLALFRNRQAGDVGIKRQFKTAVDFLDMSSPHEPRLIVPGLEPRNPLPNSLKGTVSPAARWLLRNALRHHLPGSAESKETLANLTIKYLQEMAQSGCHQHVRVKRQEHSSLHMQMVEAHVRNALMSGPASREEYEEAIRDDAFNEAEARIVRAAQKKSPKDFDRWLTNLREHGYLQLLGGTRLTGVAREETARRAKDIYCALLWKSYRLMGQCYGVLMHMICEALCACSDDQPDDAEIWLFEQRHFPQVYLAGLPLDFLEEPQLALVSPVLDRLWQDQSLDLDGYQGVTNLLGYYGELVRERRTADKNCKSRGRNSAGKGVPRLRFRPSEALDKYASPEADRLDDLDADEEARPLTSPYCPKCQARLQWDSCRDLTNPRAAKVDLYCPQCEKTNLYCVDSEQLERDWSSVADGKQQ
jgi:hypothetical protein